jgi:HD-GYP domain-containing protein (c-di-GMP phosphodiesterase class II)
MASMPTVARSPVVDSGIEMKPGRHPFPSAVTAAAAGRTSVPNSVPYPRPMGAEHTSLAVVRDWGESIEFGDDYLRGHCSRVAEQADALAGSLGIDARTRATIVAGAYLHAVGRLRLPRAIHHKPGLLTPVERATVQRIPIWGTEILAKSALPWDVKPIVRWLNERVDGTGYPDRLRGDEIPLAVQIVGIANVFVALTSPRAHRPAMPAAQAVRRLALLRTSWSGELLLTYLAQLQANYAGSLCLV